MIVVLFVRNVLTKLLLRDCSNHEAKTSLVQFKQNNFKLKFTSCNYFCTFKL